jgi:hypothetical protein
MIVSCCFTFSGVAFHTGFFMSLKEIIKSVDDIEFLANFIWAFVYVHSMFGIMIGCDHFIDLAVLLGRILGGELVKRSLND